MHTTLRVVSLALLTVALLSGVAPVGADDPGEGAVDVELEPDEAAADEGETQAYNVTVVNAEAGIGAYELNVSVGDTGVAEILDYELAADETEQGPFDGSQITGDGETLHLEVALGEAAHDPAETAGEAFTVATLTVEAVGELNESTALTATPVVEGQEVAVPGVEQGGLSEAEFYDVDNLPTQSSLLVSDEPIQTEIGLALEPATLESPPGVVDTYELVADGATEGIGAVGNLSVEVADGAVGQFVGVEMAGDPATDDTQILDEDNSPAESGPVASLNATYDEPLPGGESPVIATLDIEAVGGIADETAVTLTGEPELRDTEDTAYVVANRTGASYGVTAEMELTAPDQRYGDAVDGVSVTLRGVDSDGQNATVLVTYADGTETVVAGTATGTFDGTDLDVTLSDLGGFTEDEDGRLVGDHTAHVLLADEASQVYEPGDVVSPETVASVVDQSTMTVAEPPIPALDGFAVQVTEGLTIADDYPLNQRALFETGGLYGLSEVDAPVGDERFTPVADGQHVGLGGLPVQEEPYAWADPLLDFQARAPTQAVAVSFDPDQTSPVTLDYGEARAHGLQVAEILTVAGEGLPADAYDVTLDRGAGELVVTFDEGGESPTLWVELAWEAADPVEGLDVSDPGGIDYETDHRLVAADGDQARDGFVTFETGATGISHADTDNENDGFLGQPVAETDLGAAGAVDGTANDGSFLVRQGQRVTFETAARGDAVEVFEAVVEDGAHALGPQAADLDDTAPGRVANLDTRGLDPGRYFVTFGSGSEAVVLDVQPLDLTAGIDQTVPADGTDPVALPVGSADTTGGDVEAWFHREGTNVSDVVHVERGTLAGDGNRTLEVVPAVDLAGPGNYTVTVRHAASGVTTTVEFEAEAPDEPVLEPADDVEITSPSLLDPAEPGLFDRGDIVPIELELTGGNVATVTFGDADNQNVAVHATVHDPTFEPGEETTTLRLYLNTYQVGHGLVEGDGLEPNRPAWVDPGEWTDRRHGLFTSPHDDTPTAITDASDHPSLFDREANVYANGTTSIYGGSQGGAVVSAGEFDGDGYPGLRYDLHAAGGADPHVEPGVDRDDVNALDIEQRSTDAVRYWVAPGEGENAFHERDPTTIDEVETLKSEGVLTELGLETGPASLAENDTLVIEIESSGLEGPLHEAALRNDSLDPAALRNRTDGRVTESFLAATEATLPRTGESLLRYSSQVFENTTAFADRVEEAEENRPEPPDPEQVVLDLPVEQVIAGADETGNLADFVVPYRLEPGDELLADFVDSDRVSLEGGFTLDTGFGLEPGGGTQADADDPWGEPAVPASVNPPLDNSSLGTQSAGELQYVTPEVTFDDVHTAGEHVEVPRRGNWTLSGTTTVAPGTTLGVDLLTRTGEETPFQQTPDVEVEPGSDSPATWTVETDFAETRDSVSVQPGTEFTARIERAPGSRVAERPGLVLPDPAVETFAFEDQRSDGTFVNLAAYEASRVSTIELYAGTDPDPETDEPLGASGPLDRGLSEQVPIALDESVEESREVTAVARVTRPEAGLVLAERTATLDLDDPAEPRFDVGDLDPRSTTALADDPPVDISATVTNRGEQTGTETVTFELLEDGEPVFADERSLTLAGNETAPVSFVVDPGTFGAGEYGYVVASGDSETFGSLTVEAAPEDAAFEVLSFAPAEAVVTQGETVTVDATIENTGDREATRSVTLAVGPVEFEEQLTLDGGEVAPVSFEVDTDLLDPGEYTHSLTTDADSEDGLLVVQVPEDEETDDADDDGPGFGLVVVAAALLALALALRGRVD